jgi:AcrR family transcriptional regulator
VEVAVTENLRDQIVDAALAIAEARSWEAVRFHDVAARLAITLEDIRPHFREKEDLVEAWFDRADRAMLLLADTPEVSALPTSERLHRLVMAWLDALSAHRRVTRQMIMGKFEFGHLHIQIPGLMRVSRTVQWLREAAGREQTHIGRALEETALTSLYLVTFFYWMTDGTPGSTRTRAFLDRRLRQADWLRRRVPMLNQH